MTLLPDIIFVPLSALCPACNVSRSSTRRKRPADLLLGESGESLLTLALTLPILLGFIFGVFQLCLAYYSYEMISECAREGTRYAIFRGSTCTTSSGSSCTVTATGVQSFVSGLSFPNLAGGTMTTAASYPDGDEVPGHRVVVKVTYTDGYKILFLTTRPITMSSSSEMYIVQ